MKNKSGSTGAPPFGDMSISLGNSSSQPFDDSHSGGVVGTSHDGGFYGVIHSGGYAGDMPIIG